MDAIFASQTLDSKGRHLKPPMRIPNHGNGHRSFDLSLMNGAVQGGGGGGAASVSFAPAWTDPYSILYSNVGDLGYLVQPPAPPPLLPLPPLPLSKSYNSNIKALSYPPNNSKGSRKPNKSSSSLSSSSSSTMTLSVPSPLTPKKSSPKSKPNLKKDQRNSSKPAAKPRPDPAELPRNGFKGNINSGKQQVAGSDVEFSGSSVYILAPPPSSLPLPSFALRPKLGCNAEAVASGICTNDGLRRIQCLP